MPKLNLDQIHSTLRDLAQEDYDDGNAIGFVIKASGNGKALDLVADNIDALKQRGIYEEALVDAFTATRTNNRLWPTATLDYIFAEGDIKMFRAAGTPLPATSHLIIA